MGTRRTRRAGAGRDAARRRRAGAALGAAGALLVAGCATMPSSGPISQVSSSAAGTGQNAQVRVFPVPPKSGYLPAQLTADFLDTVTSDESKYQTAREYLTASAAQRWQADAGIAILSTAPAITAHTEGDRVRVTVSGTEVATVDSQHAYQPIAGGRAFRATLDFIRDPKAQNAWRIDQLPAGLVLNQLDFERIYQSVNLYYPTTGTGVGGDPGQPVMIPDPVFVRSRIDPMTEAAQALVDGPTDWLSPVVGSAFPTGTQLLDQSVVPDGSGTVRVHLGHVPGLGSDRTACQEMAAQLLFTLQDVSSDTVKSVQLASGATGGAVCDSGSAARYSASRMLGDETQYFVSSEGRLMSLERKDGTAHPTGGPVVPAADDGGMGGVAISRVSGGQVAVVSKGGHDLYVGTLGDSGAVGRPWATSAAGDLSVPSWDGTGTLWVADSDPHQPRVLAFNGDRPATVSVDGLNGRTVTGLRVAADGTRVALLVSDGHSTTLQLGLVKRGGRADAPTYTITALRAIAPQLVDVSAVAWAQDDALLVLGQQSGSARELQSLDTDGSLTGDGSEAVSLVEGMTTVAAFEDGDEPLLADSGVGKIYRLDQNNRWRAVATGRAPTYAG